MKLQGYEIRISAANSAFHAYTGSEEIEMRTIFRHAAEKIAAHRHSAMDWEEILFDTNGNSIGFIRAKYDDWENV